MPKLQYANCGSRSDFFIVKEGVGFKTFDSKDGAEYAHETQTILSKYDFAPKVLSRIKRMRYNGSLTGWGFETEIAEMIGCGGNDCGCGECNYIYKRYERRIANLGKRIDAKTGLEFIDGHIGNVGIIIRRGRRRLVCIDTGRESVMNDESNYDEDSYSDCSCSVCRGGS